MEIDTATTDLIDKAAMALSAAFILFGTIVLGLVELFAGKPYSPAPLTNDAGEVIATPAVDPTIRTGLVLLGLAVLFVWGLYRLAITSTESETRDEVGVTAD